MPGIDASIPLGIKTPDQMQNLSSLLGVAKGAQDVQQGGITLNERQAVQGVLADPSNYTEPDGTVNFNRALPVIMKVAPTTGMQYVQKLAEAQKAHTEAQQSLNSLTTDNRSRIGGVLAGIPPGTPADVVEKTLDTLGTQYKGMGPLVNTFKQTYRHAIQSGGQSAADDFVARAARQVLPQETQQQMNTPAGVEIGNNQQSALVNLRPGVAGVPQGAIVPGTQVQKVLPPGQQDTTITDAQGNLHVQQRDQFGNVTGTRPLQGAPTAPGGAQAPGPFTLPQGETGDTLKAVQGIRANANQAARTVPDQQFNANQIIKLADETNTGKGSQMVQNLRGGYAGIPWTSDSASNYNQLGHYMALQTSQLAQSSGLGGTDAAHGIAAEQAGNKEWTADAIKSTARVNRALSTGTSLFNQGVENAIQAGGSPFAAREFQNKWSRVATVDALRVYDAYRNRGDDAEGWKAVVKDLGGASSDKFKRVMKDVDGMRELVRGQ